jgi:protein-S-isoprenylcysteine O-methyltransferase Ste14
MASSEGSKSYSEQSKAKDNIQRGDYQTSAVGRTIFVLARAADPFLQYGILANNWGSGLLQRLGGSALPQGPPLVTNTLLDHVVGLSPYRTILLSMAVGSAVKQNFTLLTIMREAVPVQMAVMVGAFNTIFNSLNSLMFICAQTSASVNGEHFPQTPLIAGTTLYVTGMFLETFSEVQRAAWKKNPENKGKVYEEGLFGLSRHINYFGYMLWRSGYALAAGGWVWGATVAAFFTYDFTARGIPVLQHYLEEKVCLSPNPASIGDWTPFCVDCADC